jgi:hypothetical protein
MATNWWLIWYTDDFQQSAVLFKSNKETRKKKKQKSFDKFCLQSATAFDRELHVSGQSTFVVVKEEL